MEDLNNRYLKRIITLLIITHFYKKIESKFHESSGNKIKIVLVKYSP